MRALPLALALLVLVAGHAHAQPTAPGTAGDIDLPVTATAPGIVVRGEAGLDRLARHVSELAPGTLKKIYADLPGLPRPGSIEIRLVHRARDLGAAAPPGHGAPGWAAGVAYGDAGVVVVATRRNSDPIDVDSTVAHELAHMALDAAVGNRAPRWLHEGFAYLHSSDWSLARARTLTGMAWSGNVIPLAELDRSFPAREAGAQRAYAQSYDFVVFLAQRGRSPEPDDDGDIWPFRNFLASLAAGDDIEHAARYAFHASMSELYAEWYERLRQRYLTVPVGLFTLFVWVFAATLLVVGYIRKRRQNRQRLASWADEETATATAVDQEWLH